ncbi:pre-mRNA-splicing factor CWC22 homolog [Diaphorina citri]|uniref:Pre-mRNA-splicing factor CWC22 homolog n=1 Tax=Diaphorina citri TaxID=121845 RepID=A0A1S4EMW4_DIACI|nr:pre-mRNA-splicing factor CWC22 homolog [Diaphorina citri]XP_026686457.1 pre-mRNA-splicing factor CWC22 homolog [Diaphorina citri]
MQGSLLNQKPWSSSPVPEDLAIWIAEEIAVLGCNAADVFRINLPHIKSPSRDEEYLGDENEPLSDEEDGVDLASVKDWEDMGEIISRDDLFTKPSIKSIDESNTEKVVTPSDSIEDEEEVDVDKNIDKITPTYRTKKEKKRSKKEKRLKRKIKRESPAEDEEINKIVIRDVIHDSNGIMSKKKRKKIKSVDSNQFKLKKDISKGIIAEELIKTNGELRKSKKSTKKKEKRKLKDLMFNKPTNSLVVENESDSPNENTLNQKAKSLVAKNDTSSVFVNHNQTKSKTNSKLKRKLATFDPDQCDSIDIKKKKAKTKPLFKSSKTDSAKLKKQKDVKPKKVINMTNMFNVELIK